MKHRISKQSFGCLLILSFLCSCTKHPVFQTDNSRIDVYAEASMQDTKTVMNKEKVSWKGGDCIGVFVQSVQENIVFRNSSSDLFCGSFIRKGVEPGEREVYAYYPYSGSALLPSEQTIVHSNMSQNQKTPFDTSMDCMIADVSSIEYNESNMPSFNLTFNHHLFSVLKISYFNEDNAIKDQSVINVRVESKTKILSGPYSFDVSDGKDAVAVFDTSSAGCKHYFNLKNETNSKLGVGTVTTIYALIPPGKYDSGDLSVTIFTEDYYATVTNQICMDLNPDTIYYLEEINFSNKSVASSKKTVICFGDSITTGVVTDQLQSLLGYDKWLVYIAGVSGENVLQIMARQGTAPLYIKGGFKIPAHQEKKDIVNISSGFSTTFHPDGTISDTPDNAIRITLAYYTGNALYCGHTNPFLIKGVECEIQYQGSNLTVMRLSDGEQVDCTSDDYVLAVPCAAWKYGTPDVTTIYMGTNGGYTGGALGTQYARVKDNVSPKGYIGVGYHHYGWAPSYKAGMYGLLGDNFLDLRTEGVAKADTIMKSMGLELTEQDNINISNNIWPQSWGGLDVHPNTTGAKAHAYLIYYKMKELGYVE